MPKLSNNFCPCHSKKTYQQCCELYLSHQQTPATAEVLMRSRYTAYTQANIAYIQATMREKAAENYDSVAAEQWAKTAKWQRLKVIRSFPHKTDINYHYVEFIAYYIWQGQMHQLHEISEFKLIEGKWYYVDGKSSS